MAGLRTEESDRRSDTIDENNLQHLGLSFNPPVDTTEPSTGSNSRHLLSTREYTTQDTGSPPYNMKDSHFAAQVSQKQPQKGLDKTETEGRTEDKTETEGRTEASNVKFEASVTSDDVAASFSPSDPKLDVPLSQYAKSVVYTPQFPPP